MRPTVGHEISRTGLLTAEGLKKASDWRREHGGSIERALVASGAMSEEALTAAISRLSGLEAVSRERLVDADPWAVSALPADARRRLRALPFERSGGLLHVAVADPDNPVLVTGLETATGTEVLLYAVADPVLDDLLYRWERLEEQRAREKPPDPVPPEQEAADGPEIAHLARVLLSEAIRAAADGFEVGLNSKGGYSRTHHVARPALSRRLPREVVPALLRWFRTRLAESDPIDGTSFVVDVTADIGSTGLQRVVLTEAGPEGLRLSFQRTAKAPETCVHAEATGEVFCPTCGVAI